MDAVHSDLLSSRVAEPRPRASWPRRATGRVNLVEKVAFQCGLGEAASMAVRVIAAQLVVAEAEALARDRVLAADRRAEVRRVVGAQRERTPASCRRRSGCSRRLAKTPRTTFDVGHTSSTICRARELGHERRVLDRAHAVADARDRAARAPRARSPRRPTRRRAPCSRGPRRRRSRRPARRARAGSRPRRRPAEADDVGVRAARRCARRPRSPRSTPKLRTADMRMRASMPWSRRASSIPAASPRSARRR